MQKDIKKLSLYFAGFFILGIVSGYLTYKIISFSKTVEVPDLKGKSLTDAKEILREHGLYLKVEGEDYDPGITQGFITGQDIPPKTRTSSSGKIRVFISKGPVTLLMPEVIGKTVTEADAILTKNGLKVSKVIYVHSNIIDAGKVLAQTPAPRERTDEAIELIASFGPYDVIYYCPSFEGMLKEDALTLAGELGLKAELKGEGRIVKTQQPGPDTEIKAGDKILLQIEEENSL